MHIHFSQIADLAAQPAAERKRQGLTHSQTPAVCNVSPSFIRDAESQPERCSLGKLLLLMLMQGLGLTAEVNGWSEHAKPSTHQGSL